MTEKICILIPAYNPPENMTDFVTNLSKTKIDVLIVNDGSSKDYNYIFSKLKSNYIKIINLKKNIGKGFAIKAGIKEIFQEKYTHIITADADGQHTVSDIINLSKNIDNKSIVLGVRSFDKKVPFKSRIGNVVIAKIFKFLTHVELSDTQTGLRAIPSLYFDELLKIPYNGYDYEIAMLVFFIKNKINILQLKIKTVYIENNRSSHFRPIFDSLKIIKTFLKILKR